MTAFFHKMQIYFKSLQIAKKNRSSKYEILSAFHVIQVPFHSSVKLLPLHFQVIAKSV